MVVVPRAAATGSAPPSSTRPTCQRRVQWGGRIWTPHSSAASSCLTRAWCFRSHISGSEREVSFRTHPVHTPGHRHRGGGSSLSLLQSAPDTASGWPPGTGTADRPSAIARLCFTTAPALEDNDDRIPDARAEWMNRHCKVDGTMPSRCGACASPPLRLCMPARERYV